MAPWKFELKKEIGASTFCSFGCVKTVAYDNSEANVYKINWSDREGASITTYFIALNASLSWPPHLNTDFLFFIFLSLFVMVGQFEKIRWQIS